MSIFSRHNTVWCGVLVRSAIRADVQRRVLFGGIHRVIVEAVRPDRACVSARCSGPVIALFIGAALALPLAGCARDDTGDGAGSAPTREAIPGATAFGGLGQLPGLFAYPRALDSDGRSLWVIDKTARVQRIDPRSGECTLWWRMPDWALGKPVGFTVARGDDPAAPGEGGDDRNLLYIADTHYSRVMIYRPPAESHGEPELVASFGSFGRGPGQFIYPTDIAVLHSPDGSRVERLYVSEYGDNDRVSVFDGAFNFLFSFGTLGGGDSAESIEFDRPQSLALAPVRDPANPGTAPRTELIVADSRNHRIGRFTLDGGLIAWIGSPRTPGLELGRFRYPYGLASLGDGTVLVSEYGNNRVQQIDLATGTGLRAWGRPGRGRGELAAPWAVTTLNRKVFVLDSGNNRLIAFDAPRTR